jgi:copper chaperone CopZ
METRLKIDGMHCDGCTGRVKRVLEREDGVEAADVSLDTGEARVRHAEGAVDAEHLRAVVERAGYPTSVAG